MSGNGGQLSLPFDDHEIRSQVLGLHQQFMAERWSGSITLKAHYVAGKPAKVIVTPERVHWLDKTQAPLTSTGG